MRKRLAFWKIAAVTVGVWLAIIWIVQARQGGVPAAHTGRQVLQQACSSDRADLRIDAIEVTTRGIGQPFDVRVRIRNNSTGTQGLTDSWSYLYVDRTPSGAPDVQAFAQTTALIDSPSISANFTVTSGNATVGWHTVSVMIDATNDIPNEGCSGEGNNQGATSFEIKGVQPPTPTERPQPTATPFPPPQIYLFEPQEATIGYGDEVILRWQVTGESVSVTLDDEPMPVEGSLPKYPKESHVYTLRAENPGGAVQKTSKITVTEPTVTPTPTDAPCDYAVIHEFGASPSSVIRGEKVTVYWDVARATQVFLNGEPVPDVSSREFKLNRTTTFTLVGRNACGDVEEELTVQANYATATATHTPTLTWTPTRTATPPPTYTATSTPTRTPTPNMLPTHTGTPNPSASATQTATPTMTGTSSAFDSPVGTPTGTIEAPTGTITATVSISTTETAVATATWAPTSTLTPLPTWTAAATSTPSSTATPSPTSTIIQATRTVDLSGPSGGVVTTQTPNTGPSGPMLSPTAVPPASTIRLYLCPLAVLLLFAIGVVILSIVVPRIQERQQDMDDLGYSAALYGVAAADADKNGAHQESAAAPGDAAFAVASSTPSLTNNPASRPLDDSLLDDRISLDDVSFAPNGPLLDDEGASQNVSFDPLIEDLGPSGRQESERAPSASEEKN